MNRNSTWLSLKTSKGGGVRSTDTHIQKHTKSRQETKLHIRSAVHKEICTRAQKLLPYPLIRKKERKMLRSGEERKECYKYPKPGFLIPDCVSL